MDSWWKDYPWRMIQTNLREIDMKDIDAEEYVAWMRKMDATVAMINTAGIIASYQTDLPNHFQSPFLQADSLADIIAVAHREGLRVIARTDFSKVRRSLYERHPEWACIYPGGVIEDYNGDVHCCVNGDYQRIYSHEIIGEALTKLDLDGIFFNMGGFITHNYSHEYLGICRCENCRRPFAEFSGAELPLDEDMGDSVFRQYRLFRMKVLSEHKQKTVETIKSVRPEIAINHNSVDGVGFLRQESNTEIDRALPRWQYSGSANTKWAVTSWPDMVSSNTSVDFIGFFYRHVAVSPAQQELRLWQGLANCGGLDYYLIGRLDNHRDRSGYAAVQRVFGFHSEHFENTYRGLRPDSDLLLVSGGGGAQRGDDEYRGWFRMLAEGHFLFDVSILERVKSLELEKYQAIVLPDTKYLDDKTASLIDAYVAKGGTLIASGEAGLCDDQLERRQSCALQSLGIGKVRGVRRDVRSALLEVDDKSAFPSMVERDLVYFGDTFVFADYVDGGTGFLRYIPPHNFGPPERCYWTEETDLPGLHLNPHGEGRGIHIPWFAGALFHREGYDNTPQLIWDLLEGHAGIRPVGGNISPMVEITRAEAPDAGFTLLQLVNGSGHFGTSFYRPVRMGDLSFSVPLDRPPASVSCLNAGSAAYDYDARKKMLEIRLDLLDFFEAVRVDF
jgi:hypothetical protein